LALGGWFLLLGGAAAVLNVISISDEGVDADAFGMVIGLMMVGWGVAFLRVPRCGLLVHRQGITVRELRRSREWPWSEVDHFELDRSFLKWDLRIHLADGRVVSAPGLEWRRARYRRLAEAWVDELNRRAAAAAV
jgi:Bacterial PH domain